MTTSKRTDMALVALMCLLAVTEYVAVGVWLVHRPQAGKPGGRDASVEWWLAGDKQVVVTNWSGNER